MTIRKLGFTSRARAGLRAAQTSDLIATSRENNVRDDIRGVLLYTGESFLSVVEGDEASISALWRRLLVDARHRGIASLFDVTVRGPWYEDWRAGYVSEPQLAPLVAGWRAGGPTLSTDDIARVRAFCDAAPAF